MKCISLWQPWASLVVCGAKTIETRSRPGLLKPGTRVAIHAAKKWNKELEQLCLTEPFQKALGRAGYPLLSHESFLPRGAIVGTVDVLGYVQFQPDCMIVRRWMAGNAGKVGAGERMDLPGQTERAFGDYMPGRWGYVLRNPRRLVYPVPCVGRQWVFDVPDSLGLEEVSRGN